MPEFIAEHTPSNVDEFTRGYLEAAEWLIQGEDGEEIDRDKIRGFSRAAIRAAKADCRDFQRSNKKQLAEYCERTGRDMSGAGVDFWLTRNGHGAGFWDRGSDPVFTDLTKASKPYGGTDPYVSRGWIHLYG
jgi:hypothetical protein